MKNVNLTIAHDPDVECPSDWDGWKLYSFSTRHINFKHPEEAGIGRDGQGLFLGIQSKLKAGTAFVLSYFEHGGCVWSLMGEGPQCQWDSVRVAGLLYWDGKPKDVGKDYAERRKSAIGFLEQYTEWANGECYYYVIEDADTGETLDSCGGFIGGESFKGQVLEALKHYDAKVVEVNGDAGHAFEVPEEFQAEVEADV